MNTNFQTKDFPKLAKNVKKEVEYKLSSLANTQFKFMPSENSDIFLKKLYSLCNLLDISYKKADQVEIEDEYYDDERLTLKSEGCYFRKRNLNTGVHLITIKSGEGDPEHKGYQNRFEFEQSYPPKKFKEITNDASWIRKKLKTSFNVITNCGKLNKILAVKNKRTRIEINTELSTYTLCYDKYYYYYSSEGDYSEIHTEIEIEHHGKFKGTDVQVEKLRTAFIHLFNYAPNFKSKLENGLIREDLTQKIVTVYVIALDIVGYSKKTAEVQKQMIQRLGHFAKDAIGEMRGEGSEHDLVFLPTGDGMILVFLDKPETLLPIVFSLQKKIKASNKNCQTTHKFEFRTGLHAGPVFKYSDVNENLNFAGNGINLCQRVMNMGDGWHILATREGFEAMGNINTNHSYFTRLGKYPIKHGSEIEVFNVFNKLDQIGNPVHPLE